MIVDYDYHIAEIFYGNGEGRAVGDAKGNLNCYMFGDTGGKGCGWATGAKYGIGYTNGLGVGGKL